MKNYLEIAGIKGNKQAYAPPHQLETPYLLLQLGHSGVIPFLLNAKTGFCLSWDAWKPYHVVVSSFKVTSSCRQLRNMRQMEAFGISFILNSDRFDFLNLV